MTRTDAVVVGAGPNGLAAAVALARQGFRVTVLEAAAEPGGGTRSSDTLTVPGLVHDLCSAVHPFGAASPFLRSLPLRRHGLEWCHPEIAVAHPLDDGTAAVVWRDLDATVAGLGEDGPTWRRLFGRSAERFDDLAADLLGPVVRIPRRLATAVPAGLLSTLPATVVARRFRTDAARALFAGIAAHVIQPLHRPLTASVGTVMIAAGHAHGWPVAKGGSQAIARALCALLEELGGEIHCGVEVRDLRELPKSRVALLDLTPRQLAAIAGDHLPERARRRAASWRHGPAAFKLDYAVRGGVPWTADAGHRAGTLHLAGGFDEIVAAERQIHEGRLPERPYLIAAQQHLADPGRAVGDVVPFWVYAHVPHAYDGDATAVIERQIERFAPGFADRVVARNVATPADLEAHNPGYVGGDIAGGSTDPWRLVARPRLSPDPYATAIPGVFLCSSATPPGAGAHGLCGYHAARSALRVLTA